MLTEEIDYISVVDFLGKNPERVARPVAEFLGVKFYSVTNCLVACANHQQIVPEINAHGKKHVFSESFAWKHSEHVLRQAAENNLIEQENIVFLDSAAALCHVWSENFWHWMHECLPKILALEEMGFTGKYIVSNQKHVLESLTLFGIPQERLCFPGTNYIVADLVVPQLLNSLMMFDYPDLLLYARNKILDVVGILSGEKNIYTENRT